MHGDPDNLESLHNKQARELPQNHEYIQMLLETVDKDPKSWLLFGRWTGEMQTYLAEQTGIKLSGSQVRSTKRKKYSYVWAKYSLRINRIQRRAEFRETC